MTIDEKLSILVGTGIGEKSGLGNSVFPVLRSLGSTLALLQYGLPALIMTDGTSVVRIDSVRKKGQRIYYAISFSIGMSLSCTWDMNIVR